MSATTTANIDNSDILTELAGDVTRTVRIERTTTQGSSLTLDHGLLREAQPPKDDFRTAFARLIELFEFYANRNENPESVEPEQFAEFVERERQYIERNFDVPGLQALASAFFRNSEAAQEYFWTFQRLDSTPLSAATESNDDSSTQYEALVEDDRVRQLIAEGYGEFFRPPSTLSTDPAFGREVLVRRDTFSPSADDSSLSVVRRATEQALDGPFVVERQRFAVPFEQEQPFDSERLEQFFSLFFTAETGLVDLRGSRFSVDQRRELVQQQIRSFRALEQNLDSYLDFQDMLAARIQSSCNAHTGTWRLYSIDRSAIRRRGSKDRTTWRRVLQIDAHVKDVREYYYRVDGATIELGVNPLGSTHGFDRDEYRVLRYAINSTQGDTQSLAALNDRIQRYRQFRASDRQSVSLDLVPYVLDPLLLPRVECRALIANALDAKSKIRRLELAVVTRLSLLARRRRLQREQRTIQSQLGQPGISAQERQSLNRRLARVDASLGNLSERLDGDAQREKPGLIEEVAAFERGSLPEFNIQIDPTLLREYLRQEVPPVVWIDPVLRDQYLPVIAEEFASVQARDQEALVGRVARSLRAKLATLSEEQVQKVRENLQIGNVDEIIDEIAGNLGDALRVIAGDLPNPVAAPKGLPLLGTLDQRASSARPPLRLALAMSDALANYSARVELFTDSFIAFRTWQEVGEHLERTIFYEARDFVGRSLLDTSQMSLRDAASRLVADLGDDAAMSTARASGASAEQLERLRRERVDRVVRDAEQLVSSVQLRFFNRLPESISELSLDELRRPTSLSAERELAERQAELPKVLASYKNPDDPYHALFIDLLLEYHVKHVDERDRAFDFVAQIDGSGKGRARLFDVVKRAQAANSLYRDVVKFGSVDAQLAAVATMVRRQQSERNSTYSRRLERESRESGDTPTSTALFDMATLLQRIESPLRETASSSEASSMRQVRTLVDAVFRAGRRRASQVLPRVRTTQRRSSYVVLDMTRFGLDDGTYIVQQFNRRQARYVTRGMIQLYVLDSSIGEIRDLDSDKARSLLAQSASIELPKSLVLYAEPDWTRSLLLPTYSATLRSITSRFLRGTRVRWYFVPSMTLMQFYRLFGEAGRQGQVARRGDREKYREMRNLSPAWNTRRALVVSDPAPRERRATKIESLRIGRLKSDTEGVYFCVEETSDKTFRRSDQVTPTWLPLYNVLDARVVRNERIDALSERSPLLPSNLVGVFQVEIGASAKHIRCPFGDDVVIDARPFIVFDDEANDDDVVENLVMKIQWFKRSARSDGSAWFPIKNSDEMSPLSAAELRQAGAERSRERVESDKRFAEFAYVYLTNVDADDEGSYRCSVRLELRKADRALDEPIEFDLVFSLSLTGAEERDEAHFKCVRCNRVVDARDNGPDSCQWHSHPPMLETLQSYAKRDASVHNFDSFFAHYYSIDANRSRVHDYVQRFFPFAIDTEIGSSSLESISALIHRAPVYQFFANLSSIDPSNETLARYSATLVDKFHWLVARMVDARVQLPRDSSSSSSSFSGERRYSVDEYTRYIERALTRARLERSIFIALKHAEARRRQRPKHELVDEIPDYTLNNTIDDFFTLRRPYDALSLSERASRNQEARGIKLELTRDDYTLPNETFPALAGVSHYENFVTGPPEHTVQGNPRQFYGLRDAPSVTVARRRTVNGGGTRGDNDGVTIDHFWQWRCCNQAREHPGCWRGRHSRFLRDPDFADSTSTLNAETMAYYNRHVAAEASNRHLVTFERNGLLFSDDGILPVSSVFLHDDRVIRTEAGSFWQFTRNKDDANERYFDAELATVNEHFASVPSSESATFSVLSREAVFNRLLGAKVQYPWSAFLHYALYCNERRLGTPIRFEWFKIRVLRSGLFDRFAEQRADVQVEDVLGVVDRFMSGEWAFDDRVMPSTSTEMAVLHDLKSIVFDFYTNHFGIAQKLLTPPSEFRDQLLNAARTRSPKKPLPFLIQKQTYAEDRADSVDLRWQYNLPRFGVWVYDDLFASSLDARDRSPSFAARFNAPESVRSQDTLVRRVAQAAKAVAYAYRIDQSSFEELQGTIGARRRLREIFGPGDVPFTSTTDNTRQSSRQTSTSPPMSPTPKNASQKTTEREEDLRASTEQRAREQRDLREQEQQQLLQWLADVRSRRERARQQENYVERMSALEATIRQRSDKIVDDIDSVKRFFAEQTLDQRALDDALRRVRATSNETINRIESDRRDIAQQQETLERALDDFSELMRNYSTTVRVRRPLVYTEQKHQELLGRLDERLDEIDRLYRKYAEPKKFVETFVESLDDQLQAVRAEEQRGQALVREQQSVREGLSQRVRQLLASTLTDDDKRSTAESYALQRHLYEMANATLEQKPVETLEQTTIKSNSEGQPRMLYRYFLQRLLSSPSDAADLSSARPDTQSLAELVTRYGANDEQWQKRVRAATEPDNSPLDTSFTDVRRLETVVDDDSSLQQVIAEAERQLGAEATSDFLERTLARLVVADPRLLAALDNDTRSERQLASVVGEIRATVDRVVGDYRSRLVATRERFVSRVAARLDNRSLYNLDAFSYRQVTDTLERTRTIADKVTKQLTDGREQLQRLTDDSSIARTRQDAPREFDTRRDEIEASVTSLQLIADQLTLLDEQDPLVPGSLKTLEQLGAGARNASSNLPLFDALARILWESLRVQRTIRTNIERRSRTIESLETQSNTTMRRIDELVGELLLLSSDALVEAVERRFPQVASEVDFQRYKLLREYASQLNEDEQSAATTAMQDANAEQEAIEQTLRVTSNPAADGNGSRGATIRRLARGAGQASAEASAEQQQALRDFLAERVPQFNAALQRAFMRLAVPLLADNLKEQVPPLERATLDLVRSVRSQSEDLRLFLAFDVDGDVSNSLVVRAFSTLDRDPTKSADEALGDGDQFRSAIRNSINRALDGVEVLPRTMNVFATDQRELVSSSGDAEQLLRLVVPRLSQLDDQSLERSSSTFESLCKLYIDQVRADLQRLNGALSGAKIDTDRRLVPGGDASRRFTAAERAFTDLMLLTSRTFPFRLTDDQGRPQTVPARSGELVAKEMLAEARGIRVKDQVSLEFNTIVREQLLKYQALFNQLYARLSRDVSSRTLVGYGPHQFNGSSSLDYLQTRQNNRLMPDSLLVLNQYAVLSAAPGSVRNDFTRPQLAELREAVAAVPGFASLPQFTSSADRAVNYIWPPNDVSSRGRTITVAGKRLYDTLAHFDQRVFSPLTVDDDHTNFFASPLFTYLTVVVHASLRAHLVDRLEPGTTLSPETLRFATATAGDYATNFNRSIRVAGLYVYRESGATPNVTDLASVFDEIALASVPASTGDSPPPPSYQQMCSLLIDALDAYWSNRSADDLGDLLELLREKDSLRGFGDSHESDSDIFDELTRQANDSSSSASLVDRTTSIVERDEVTGDLYAKQVTLETIAFLAFFENFRRRRPLFASDNSRSSELLRRACSVLATLGALAASYAPDNLSPSEARLFSVLDNRSLMVDLLNFYYLDQRAQNSRLFFLQPLRAEQSSDQVGPSLLYHRGLSIRTETLDSNEIDDLFALTLATEQDVATSAAAAAVATGTASTKRVQSLGQAERFERVLDYLSDQLQLNRFLLRERDGEQWSIVARSRDNQWTLIESSGTKISQSAPGQLFEEISRRLAEARDSAQIIVQRQLVTEIFSSTQRPRRNDVFEARTRAFFERRTIERERSEDAESAATRRNAGTLFVRAARRYAELARIDADRTTLVDQVLRVPLQYDYEPYYLLDLWLAQYRLYLRQAELINSVGRRALETFVANRLRLERELFPIGGIYDSSIFSLELATQGLVSIVLAESIPSLDTVDPLYVMFAESSLRHAMGVRGWQDPDTLVEFALGSSEEASDLEPYLRFFSSTTPSRQDSDQVRQSVTQAKQIVSHVQRLHDVYARMVRRYLHAALRPSADAPDDFSANAPFVFPRLYNDVALRNADQQELAALSAQEVQNRVASAAGPLVRRTRTVAANLYLLAKADEAERRALVYERAVLARFWNEYIDRVSINAIEGDDNEQQRLDALTPFDTYTTLLNFDAASRIVRTTQASSSGTLSGVVSALARSILSSFSATSETPSPTPTQDDTRNEQATKAPAPLTTVRLLLDNGINVYTKQPGADSTEPLKETPISGLTNNRQEPVTPLQVVKSVYNASIASLSRLTAAKIDMSLNPDRIDPDGSSSDLFEDTAFVEVPAVTESQLSRASGDSIHYSQLPEVLLGIQSIRGLGSKYDRDSALLGDQSASSATAQGVPVDKLYYDSVLQSAAALPNVTPIGTSLRRRAAKTVFGDDLRNEQSIKRFSQRLSQRAKSRQKTRFDVELLRASVRELQQEPFVDRVLADDVQLWFEKMNEQTRVANRNFNRQLIAGQDRTVGNLRGVPLIPSFHFVDGENQLRYANDLLQESFFTLERVPLFAQRYIPQFERLALIADSAPKIRAETSVQSRIGRSILDEPKIELLRDDEHEATRENATSSGEDPIEERIDDDSVSSSSLEEAGDVHASGLNHLAAALFLSKPPMASAVARRRAMPVHPLLYRNHSSSVSDFANMHRCVDYRPGPFERL